MVRLFRKKKKDPKKVLAECLSAVRKEKRETERHIQTLQKEEEKAKKSIRQCQKQGVPAGCRPLAVSIVKARKTVRRLQTAKLRLDAMEINLQQQRSAIRVTGAVESSAEVTAAMSELVKVPEMRKSADALSKQLLKLGLIEEQVHETFSDVTNTDDLDTEDDADIEQVLSETGASALKDRSQKTAVSARRSVPVDMVAEQSKVHKEPVSGGKRATSTKERGRAERQMVAA